MMTGATARADTATAEPMTGTQSAEAMPLPQPPAIACQPSADRIRATRLGRALDAGFGVQYWGDQYTAEGLAAQPHGLIIIEAAKLGAHYSTHGREEFFSADEIAQISHGGTRPVLGYVNVSEIEDYRDYWVDLDTAGDGASGPPVWFGPLAQHGDRLAAYWVEGWRDVLMGRVDRLMASGVNGLFLDDVLHYYTHAKEAHSFWPAGQRPEGPADAPGLAKAMMALVVAVADRVREWDCDAFVVVNNGAFIGRDAGGAEGTHGSLSEFDSYRAAIDGILVENAMSPAAHPSTRVALTEDFLDVGVQVMTVDELKRFHSSDLDAVRDSVAADAFRSGFHPYLIDEGWFSRLWEPLLAKPSG